MPVPGRLLDALGSTDDPRERHRLGTRAGVDLVNRVLDGGAPGVHVYTFNKHEAALDLLEGADLVGGRRSAVAPHDLTGPAAPPPRTTHDTARNPVMTDTTPAAPHPASPPAPSSATRASGRAASSRRPSRRSGPGARRPTRSRPSPRDLRRRTRTRLVELGLRHRRPRDPQRVLVLRPGAGRDRARRRGARRASRTCTTPTVASTSPATRPSPAAAATTCRSR